ncbi:MAG: hypothetical protein QM765_38910 [Myxococcales bacterium]
MIEPIHHPRPVCQMCMNAPARFYYHGRWSSRADHDLCPCCFTRLMNRLRAEKLSGRGE